MEDKGFLIQLDFMTIKKKAALSRKEEQVMLEDLPKELWVLEIKSLLQEVAPQIENLEAIAMFSMLDLQVQDRTATSMALL